MFNERCPVPIKKLRVQSSSDNSDNEDLNFSPYFEETYKKLMKDELVMICLNKCSSMEAVNVFSTFIDFTKKCDELSPWVESLQVQNKRQSLCRSDFYLEKICRRKQLLQSSRLLNIKMLAKVLVSKEPHLHDEVWNRIQDIENQWHIGVLFDEATISHTLDDINGDIADLTLWLDDIKQKLNFDLAYSSRKQDVEFTEYILRNFEVHNQISLSIIKVIKELQDLAPQCSYSERINLTKSSMDSVESAMYHQWLKAIECKMRLEENDGQVRRPSHLGALGHESGFESELSPIYNARKLRRASTTPAMGFISSGDNMSDCSTDFPPDSSGSTTLSIDKTSPLVSSLSSSVHMVPSVSQVGIISREYTASPHNRIIRRKKRRSKRLNQVGLIQCNLSTEESDFNATRNSLKRRINDQRTLPMTEMAHYSSQVLNYAEIADAAERMVRNISSRGDNSGIESAKESEPEYIDTQKDSLNDIDIDKNWDYYQASMYSNEEGDSQIIEVENINEWVPEIDSDAPEVVLPEDSSPSLTDKILLMLTSGYETSIENTDPTSCSKSLICVLQFTTRHYHEVEQKLLALTDNRGDLPISSFDLVLSTSKECDSVAQLHLKLLQQMLHHDPCRIAHSTKLIDNLNVMEGRWNRIRDMCLAVQLRLIGNRIADPYCYDNIEELRRSISVLQDLCSMIRAARASINVGNRGDGESLLLQVEEIEKELLTKTEARVRELGIVSRSVSCVAQSKCTRKLFACELRMSREEGFCGTFDVKDLYRKFESCIVALKTCSESVCSLSSPECQGRLLTSINKEVRLWETMCTQASNAPSSLTLCDVAPLDNRHQSPSNIFSRLPLHIALIAFAVIIGYWYNQSSSNACGNTGSVLDLYRLFQRYQGSLDPH